MTQDKPPTAKEAAAQAESDLAAEVRRLTAKVAQLCEATGVPVN